MIIMAIKYLKEILKVINFKDMEFIIMKMDIKYMKENLKIINVKDME